MSAEQMAEFAQIIEAGPVREKEGVVRRCRIDLKRIIAERFGVDFHERYVRTLLKNPSPAEARLLATETELISCRLEGSGRFISGGGNPVKERGPCAVAHLRVVTPLRRSRSGS